MTVSRRYSLRIVMPGLVPGIHVARLARLDVDGRDKPGHDAESPYFPTHFGGRFSANAFGPSM
ncbi:hypothetical protein CWO91_01030 [Bradyrhizobium genosp. SA-3]|nr:hypothetical protein CWO91_01030 [Bradyrhizobium genosp. SA-3]